MSYVEDLYCAVGWETGAMFHVVGLSGFVLFSAGLCLTLVKQLLWVEVSAVEKYQQLSHPIPHKQQLEKENQTFLQPHTQGTTWIVLGQLA